MVRWQKPVGRILFATTLLAALFTIVLLGNATPAFASSCTSGYRYAGYYTDKWTNEGIQGYIDPLSIGVIDYTSEHALTYVSSQSPYGDDAYAGAGSDWIQVGYGVGNVDYNDTKYSAIYEEASDLNTVNGQG